MLSPQGPVCGGILWFLTCLLFENFDIWHFTITRRVCAGANPCAPVLPHLHLHLHLLLLPGGGHLYSVVYLCDNVSKMTKL